LGVNWTISYTDSDTGQVHAGVATDAFIIEAGFALAGLDGSIVVAADVIVKDALIDGFFEGVEPFDFKGNGKAIVSGVRIGN
jgi:hypothetical protein